VSWGGVWPGQVDPVHFAYPGFVAPQSDPALIQLCDFLSGFTPLGSLQLADAIATYVAPLHSSPQSMERKVQAFIQGPCSSIYRAVS
jgi:hypothetical protein